MDVSKDFKLKKQLKDGSIFADGQGNEYLSDPSINREMGLYQIFPKGTLTAREVIKIDAYNFDIGLISNKKKWRKAKSLTFINFL